MSDKTCDCKNYERQVCDICQNVTGQELDKPTTPISKKETTEWEQLNKYLDKIKIPLHGSVEEAYFSQIKRSTNNCRWCQRKSPNFCKRHTPQVKITKQNYYSQSQVDDLLTTQQQRHSMLMAGLEAQIEQKAVIRASELLDKRLEKDRQALLEQVEGLAGTFKQVAPGITTDKDYVLRQDVIDLLKKGQA